MFFEMVHKSHVISADSLKIYRHINLIHTRHFYACFTRAYSDHLVVCVGGLEKSIEIVQPFTAYGLFEHFE